MQLRNQACTRKHKIGLGVFLHWSIRKIGDRLVSVEIKWRQQKNKIKKAEVQMEESICRNIKLAIYM